MPLNNFNRHIPSLRISHWITIVSNRFNPSGWLLTSMSVYGLNDGEEGKKWGKSKKGKKKNYMKRKWGHYWWEALLPCLLNLQTSYFSFTNKTPPSTSWVHRVQIPRAIYEQKTKWKTIPHHSMLEQKL
jgi:hypothetical protein